MKHLLFLLVIAAATEGLSNAWASCFALQDPPPKKPVLIRADEPDDEFEKITAFDPEQAEESFEIGNFYFKRKNYAAAENRYRQAIGFHPKWPEPYDRLVEALRKQKKFQEAIDVCDLFLATNEDSDKADHFRRLAEDLSSKSK